MPASPGMTVTKQKAKKKNTKNTKTDKKTILTFYLLGFDYCTKLY